LISYRLLCLRFRASIATAPTSSSCQLRQFKPIPVRLPQQVAKTHLRHRQDLVSRTSHWSHVLIDPTSFAWRQKQRLASERSRRCLFYCSRKVGRTRKLPLFS
jgi:hypothetical protein